MFVSMQDKVKVKIAPLGLTVMDLERAKYSLREDGYYEFRLHEFMRVFGQRLERVEEASLFLQEEGFYVV